VVLRAIDSGEPIRTALASDEFKDCTRAATPEPGVCSNSVAVNTHTPCFKSELEIAEAIGCESILSRVNA
jgi:hypothetical protein